MNDKNSLLRHIPQVEKILQATELEGHLSRIGRAITTRIVRDELDRFREKTIRGESPSLDELLPSIEKRCRAKAMERLQRVINGTGVIIHTNLGRAPLGTAALQKLASELSGYCNLELHLPTEKRGKRGGFAEELACELTGAQDALIVNNNASSVFLILSCFARGREVIVSRGELVQIGGGFRIPDIMAQTGAMLVEVGTTNITTIDDYRDALTDNTAMVFSAHQSNFRIEGFTAAPSLADLAALKNENIIAVRDLGSGNLTALPDRTGPFEPTAASELSQGMDLICFSGDKLLGGPQAGIIAGRSDLIAALRKHPLMRMLRVDKITYYLLQEALLAYARARQTDVPVRDIIATASVRSRQRARKLVKKASAAGRGQYITAVPTPCAFGGGSMPAVEMESAGLAITIPGVRPEELYSFFIGQEPPVVGLIANETFIIDLSSVFDSDLAALQQSIAACLDQYCG
jgi:L-seryl-tRNA(Ser) seleniumtransferase